LSFIAENLLVKYCLFICSWHFSRPLTLR